jgi:hypothetical protein
MPTRLQTKISVGVRTASQIRLAAEGTASEGAGLT